LWSVLCLTKSPIRSMKVCPSIQDHHFGEIVGTHQFKDVLIRASASIAIFIIRNCCFERFWLWHRTQGRGFALQCFLTSKGTVSPSTHKLSWCTILRTIPLALFCSQLLKAIFGWLVPVHQLQRIASTRVVKTSVLQRNSSRTCLGYHAGTYQLFCLELKYSNLSVMFHTRSCHHYDHECDFL
jgi:hypothetical protein